MNSPKAKTVPSLDSKSSISAFLDLAVFYPKQNKCFRAQSFQNLGNNERIDAF